MKKYLLTVLLSSAWLVTYAQEPDTSTLEKKARYVTSRIRDNNKRAITPLDFRKAFTSAIDLSLSLNSLSVDVATQPTMSMLPAAYPDGLKAYKISTSRGWPFDGILTVIKSPDGATVQRIVATNSTFADERVRSSYNADWTAWDYNTFTATVDVPLILDGDVKIIHIPAPGLDSTSRVKRLSSSIANSDIKLSTNISANDISVAVWNNTGVDVDLGDTEFSVLVEDYELQSFLNQAS